MGYVSEQRECASDDAETVARMAQAIGAALDRCDWLRATQAARSVAVFALGIAARLEQATAYESGMTAALATANEKPQLPSRQREHARAKRKPVEFGVNGEWLTVAEISERTGVVQTQVRRRIRQFGTPGAVMAPAANKRVR